MAETPKKEAIEVVLKNWRAEVETARVYRDLAERESDEKRKAILIRMAEAEERHAHRWEQKLRDMGQPIPTLADTLWTRLQRKFTRSLGTDIAIRRMEAAEEKHEREFSAQRHAGKARRAHTKPEREIPDGGRPDDAQGPRGADCDPHVGPQPRLTAQLDTVQFGDGHAMDLTGSEVARQAVAVARAGPADDTWTPLQGDAVAGGSGTRPPML